MKLDDLITLAKRCASSSDVSLAEIRKLGIGVVDLLAEAAPCGISAARGSRGIVKTIWGDLGDLSPADARAVGRLLFEGADEAEEPETEIEADPPELGP